MEVFGEKLRELRRERNLSMKDFAKTIDATDAAVSNWENNVNQPKISYLKKISEKYGVSTDYLLGLEN